MKIAEIHKLELHNKDCCILVKDGIFWRAYEKSAMWYCSHVKEYQIIAKYYKNIQAKMVHIGFPYTVLDSTLEQCKKKGFKINRSENLIEISGFEGGEGFDNWKSQFQEITPSVAENKAGYAISKRPLQDVDMETVEDKLRQFPIANKTPMECQQFLFKLQEQINGNI